MHDHRKKLEWARKHLDALEKSMGIFFDSTPYHLSIKFNPETGANEARVVNLRKIDPDWSMMVGDIIHAMRSSLDSLVYALVVKGQGVAPTDYKILRAIQFPISDGPANFKTECYRIALVPDLAKTAIEGLQPYKRRMPHHPLAVLRDLANIDKHRHIILTYHRATDVSIKIFGPNIPVGAKFGSGFAGRIEEGTLIGSVTVYPFEWAFPVPLPPKMHVDPRFTLAVHLSAGKQSGKLLPGLGRIWHTIDRDVFPELEGFLE